MKRNPKRIALFATVASIPLVVVLGGCSGQHSPTLSLAEAKKQTISAELEILAFVPSSDVATTTVSKSSRVIFPCLGKQNESYWPGSALVTLKPGSNTSSVLAAILTHWTTKSGWSVYRSNLAGDVPKVDIKSNSGYNFVVEFDSGADIAITAGSACFDNSGLSGRSSY